MSNIKIIGGWVQIKLRDNSGCLRERETQVFALEECLSMSLVQSSGDKCLEEASEHVHRIKDQVILMPPGLLFNMGINPYTLLDKNYPASGLEALKEAQGLEVTVMPADWSERSSRDGGASDRRRPRDALSATVQRILPSQN